MKTITPKEKDIVRSWVQVNANGKVLGRLATRIASILRGKNKPLFVPNLDLGDYVVVTNAEKVVLTKNKEFSKTYKSYSGYPGGLKEIPYKKMMSKKPEQIIKNAVKGMLPKGPLGREMFRKLKVYAGEDHPHQSQKPKVIDL